MLLVLDDFLVGLVSLRTSLLALLESVLEQFDALADLLLLFDERADALIDALENYFDLLILKLLVFLRLARIIHSCFLLVEVLLGRTI